MISIKNNSIVLKLKEKGPLRFIFQNILISFLIIMIYFYISELSGSISTIYLNNQSFTIEFGITLVIFTILVKVSGAFHGIIAGFSGELLYQIAFYNSVYLEWCIIVGFYGFIFGLYKYKPLKYQSSKNIYLTLISLILAGILSSLFIILLFYILFYYSLSLYTIFIAYGFKFFIQSIISTLLIVPIVLYMYDRFLALKEHNIYNEILTHHPLSEEGVTHTFYLRLGRSRVYLCSRCSGMFIGVISSFSFLHVIEKIFKSQYSPELAILSCLILPIPGLVDWCLQAIQIRSSNTKRRLLSGFLIGIALHMIAFTTKYYIYLLLILLTYFGIFFYFLYKKQKILKKQFEKEFNHLQDIDK
ncbi:MAG: DUF2085 domain-containing protein [Promethearchaeota archaeon]